MVGDIPFYDTMLRELETLSEHANWSSLHHEKN
jgi:hypothetical protein